MAWFYGDESFPLEVVEAGQANQRIPDHAVLGFATSHGRTILTLNRWDFVRLHSRLPQHAGIVACTQDADSERQAAAIDLAVGGIADLSGRLFRVNRPG